MNRHEKIAWFNLAVIAFTGLLYLVLLFTQGTKVAPVAMAVSALMACGPRLFLVDVKSDREKVLTDGSIIGHFAAATTWTSATRLYT